MENLTQDGHNQDLSSQNQDTFFNFKKGRASNISSQDMSKYTNLTLDKYISDEKCIKATCYIVSINYNILQV